MCPSVHHFLVKNDFFEHRKVKKTKEIQRNCIFCCFASHFFEAGGRHRKVKKTKENLKKTEELKKKSDFNSSVFFCFLWFSFCFLLFYSCVCSILLICLFGRWKENKKRKIAKKKEKEIMISVNIMIFSGLIIFFQ